MLIHGTLIRLSYHFLILLSDFYNDIVQITLRRGQPTVASSIGHLFKANQTTSMIRDYIVDGGLALRGS